MLLTNRKCNFGPLQPPISFKIEFGETRTTLLRTDAIDCPDAAKPASVPMRMAAALRGGPLELRFLSESIDAKIDTVSRNVRKQKNKFTTLADGRIAQVGYLDQRSFPADT